MKTVLAAIGILSLLVLPGLAEEAAGVTGTIEARTAEMGAASGLTERVGDRVQAGFESGSIAFEAAWDGRPIIAGKYFLTDSSAILLGLGLEIQTEDEDQGQEAGQVIDIIANYQSFFTSTRLAPYMVGGAELGIKSGDAYEDDDDVYLTLVGGFGAEFFVWENFAIAGEWTVRLQVNPSIVFRTSQPAVKAVFFF